MNERGTLKGLKITMKKHPSCFKLNGELVAKNEAAYVTAQHGTAHTHARTHTGTHRSIQPNRRALVDTSMDADAHSDTLIYTCACCNNETVDGVLRSAFKFKSKGTQKELARVYCTQDQYEDSARLLRTT